MFKLILYLVIVGIAISFPCKNHGDAATTLSEGTEGYVRGRTNLVTANFCLDYQTCKDYNFFFLKNKLKVS
jgi:hypothetical protein